MNGLSSPVNVTSDWKSICFSVYTEKLGDLLPKGYIVKATDRQKLIVAEQSDPAGEPVRNVVANQSSGYSLVPHSLIREAVDRCLTSYQLNVLSTGNYEYNPSCTI
ncbi:hypothetical protein CLV58_13115 [Spirosoma oryzae]|uniref:Uncharacterized protein n=1 Tax=Spirosoma oryzae TaxID=1469603 RepID=A0A2T0S314_9BACT|nr:hypothetical protein [Spirosoma oryzae]PRY27797.1 hypothetical protein CLV58_13115 [Spirosoma oryzae]